MSNAISAKGTLLKVSDGASPPVYNTIAEIRSLSGPTFQADVLDATVHNTPSAWRQFISGLLDGGEISMDINFIPTDATHEAASTGLLYLFQNRVQRNFQLVFPDTGNTTWTIPGIVTGFEMSADPADILSASVTIKVNGAPTFS
jgi:predicted secreted protein